MREIKFRAWHTVHNRMYEHKDIPILIKNVKDDTVWKYMQYTGLKDKTGKEIYESDIIREDNVTCCVIWNEKLASFSLSKSGWMYDHFFGEGVNAEMCEVIGNKYENPDLLTEISEP